MVPPPIPVMVPISTKPMMSMRYRAAVSAPLTANTTSPKYMMINILVLSGSFADIIIFLLHL
jgi:hypothetical protein